MNEHGHTDLNVSEHATTTNPQPEDRPGLDLRANPLREYLEAIAIELLIAKGDVRQTWEHALALALEYSYGIEPHEAEGKVASALRTADQHMREDAAAGLEWDEIKYDRARDMITWVVLR